MLESSWGRRPENPLLGRLRTFLLVSALVCSAAITVMSVGVTPPCSGTDSWYLDIDTVTVDGVVQGQPGSTYGEWPGSAVISASDLLDKPPMYIEGWDIGELWMEPVQ